MSAGDYDIAAIRAAFDVIDRRLEALCAIGQLADVGLRKQAYQRPRRPRVGPPPTTGRSTSASRLLTEEQIAEIRDGVRSGLPRAPILRKWIERLLADHDERVRLEKEREKG